MKKNRDKERLFIVEGEKMVFELLKHWSSSIVCICTTEEELDYSGELFIIDEQVLKEISSLKTPNKYLAVVKIPKLSNDKAEFILAVDGVQDPGNMGTILRTADWFKIDRVICSKETVDIFNPKVIQSSMGSLFRTPVDYLDLNDFVTQSKLPVYGALLEGKNIYTQQLMRKGIIIVGNEGNGITHQLKELIQHPLHIPRLGGAESLNVSIATGIILSEFSR